MLWMGKRMVGVGGEENEWLVNVLPSMLAMELGNSSVWEHTGRTTQMT